MSSRNYNTGEQLSVTNMAALDNRKKQHPEPRMGSFFLKFLLISVFGYVCACLSVRIPHVCRCTWRPEGGPGSPGTAVTDAGELPDVGMEGNGRSGVLRQGSKGT